MHASVQSHAHMSTSKDTSDDPCRQELNDGKNSEAVNAAAESGIYKVGPSTFMRISMGAPGPRND